jgi:folate-binding protein YgfZ
VGGLLYFYDLHERSQEMWRSPLHETHRRLGATFVESGEWEVPQSFQGLEAEYHAARQTAALVDRTPVGRLRMTGPDALDLLNRLSTNTTDPLPVSGGTTTVLITPKGRIVDWLTVLHPADDALILFTAPERPHAVTEWIDKYTIIEEISLEELTQNTVQLCILGPEAAGIVDRALGASAAALPLYGCLQLSQPLGWLLAARIDPLGLPGFDLVAPVDAAEELWGLLMEAAQEAGAVPMGEEAWEALRVEAGVPRWGAELTERYNPLEANLLQAISWDKGCYIGQEVVARLNTYHKVQRYLVGLAFEDGGDSLAPGATLTVDGTPAGVLTSLATVPGSGQKLGLGYLRAHYVKHGTEVVATTEDDGAVRGAVIRAPEVPESLVPAALLAAEDEEEEE